MRKTAKDLRARMLALCPSCWLNSLTETLKNRNFGIGADIQPPRDLTRWKSSLALVIHISADHWWMIRLFVVWWFSSQLRLAKSLSSGSPGLVPYAWLILRRCYNQIWLYMICIHQNSNKNINWLLNILGSWSWEKIKKRSREKRFFKR